MFSPENLKEIRLKKGYSQTKIAKHLGVTRSAYSSWETGVFKPNNKNLNELASFLGVTIQHFEFGYEILDRYSKLYSTNKNKLIDYANNLYISQLFPYKVHTKLSAGSGNWYDETSGYDIVYYEHKIHYDIASWINGDSMEPKYHNGDVALISTTGFDYDRLVYAVVHDEHTYIKKVYIDGDDVRLISINDKYKDIIVPLNEIKVVGAVVGSFKPINIEDYADY